MLEFGNKNEFSMKIDLRIRSEERRVGKECVP